MAPNFSPDYIAEMRQLARERGKYFAIAQLRQQHGLSLFEADNLMTAWERGDIRQSIGGESQAGGSAAARGGTTSHDEDIRDNVLPLIQSGQLIEAIKRVREHTGWGLKEAKDYLDQLQQHPELTTGMDGRPDGQFSPDANLNKLIAAIAPYVMKDKIKAIKIIREHTGLELKEAKEYSEAVQDALKKGWPPPPLPPGSRPIVPQVSSPPPMPPPIPAAPPPEPVVESPKPTPIKPAASQIVDPPKPAWMTQKPGELFKPAGIYKSPSRLNPEASGYMNAPPPKPILDSPEPPPLDSFEPPPAPDMDDGKPSTQERMEAWYKAHEAANAHRSISEPPKRKGCLVMFVLGGAAVVAVAIAAAAKFIVA